MVKAEASDGRFAGLYGLLGQKFAGRAAQKLGDFVEVSEVVFFRRIRIFHHTDKSGGYTDSVRKRSLRYFLSEAFPADGVDYIDVECGFQKAIISECKTKNYAQ